MNGNGIREADGDSFDDDGLKNVSFRLSRTFNDRVRVGAFTYWGKTRGIDAHNRTYYIGPDLAVSFSDRV